jgi:hypothetical protein
MKIYGGTRQVSLQVVFRPLIASLKHVIKGCPAGVIPISELEKLNLYQRNNPFDSSEESSITSSPSSSDEELYTHALSLPTPMQPVQASTRRPPPPPPR